MDFPFLIYLFLKHVYMKHFYTLFSQQFLELCFLDKEDQLVSQMVENLLILMLYFVVSSIL